MSVSISTYLRNVFYADALISGAAGLLMILGAPLLAPVLGLPEALLLGAGIILVPFVAMLIVVARRETVSRLVLIDIIAINAVWVAASFGLLFSGLVAPTALGVAFVAVQAVAVALFAQAQFVGMRRAAA
ncbi:hypothetical protein [Arvimicrobium flavum]|uniref:hypothetical protein n=1 Tax=Arvimicrobium flavum TaxID=3393320 RepID=UPI00237C09D5|nr:hypothetical protein [Mesorhizobium shangrilense]